jgi:hypothetical protein
MFLWENNWKMTICSYQRWGHSQRTMTPELIHDNKNKQILYENVKQKSWWLNIGLRLASRLTCHMWLWLPTVLDIGSGPSMSSKSQWSQVLVGQGFTEETGTKEQGYDSTEEWPHQSPGWTEHQLCIALSTCDFPQPSAVPFCLRLRAMNTRTLEACQVLFFCLKLINLPLILLTHQPWLMPKIWTTNVFEQQHIHISLSKGSENCSSVQANFNTGMEPS